MACSERPTRRSSEHRNRTIRRRSRLLLAAALTFVALPGSAADEPNGSGEGGPLVPLPAKAPPSQHNPITPEKVALGKQLFFDPRLSGDNGTSCATCHDPAKFFADGLARAKGQGGRALGRNTPTLLNVGFHRVYFWDGAATSLEDQALVPIRSPDEMNQEIEGLEKELNALPGYVKQFESVFGAKVTRDGIAKALAAFERTLIAKPSPFDRFLKGDEGAFSDDAKEGMRLFSGDAGCIQCHRGPLLSDGKYYRLGVGTGDRGRGAITGKKEDDYKFRTPSLRFVSRTGPYMHDGSFKSLLDVVTYYYRSAPQRASDGVALDIEPLLGHSFSEIAPIVAFLECLSGEPLDLSAPPLP